MKRNDLISNLKKYVAFNSKEELMRERLLGFVENHENCFKRELLIGHVTGSCWVVNPEKTQVLLINHVKLNKWLQPGGHCDGNEDVYAVAEKELGEETGLKPLFKTETIFDVDIHNIPERKGVPAHEHFDIRYLFVVDPNAPLVQNHETNGMQWLTLESIQDFTQEESVLRMRDKMMG